MAHSVQPLPVPVAPLEAPPSSSWLGRSWQFCKLALCHKDRGPTFWAWEATRDKIPLSVGRFFDNLGVRLNSIPTVYGALSGGILWAIHLFGVHLALWPVFPFVMIVCLSLLILEGLSYALCSFLPRRKLPLATQIETTPLLALVRVRRQGIWDNERRFFSPSVRVPWVRIFDYYTSVKTLNHLAARIAQEGLKYEQIRESLSFKHQKHSLSNHYEEDRYSQDEPLTIQEKTLLAHCFRA